MQSFSSLRGPKPLACDVILSFGDDTHFGFSGHLAHHLKKRGFRVCINHHREEATIKCGGIFIIVFSVGFASSSACLDRLVNTINERNGRRIFPVFYEVEPSHVRHQGGSFGEALAVHKNQFPITEGETETERFVNWTKALYKVADFSGCHLDRAKDKYEYVYIEEILQEVSQHMACSVGLDRRVEKVMFCLYSGSDDGVRIVGICGVQGIGKTTIARAVYPSNADNGFDYCCFVDKGGEYPSNRELERILLSKIVGDSSAIFENVDEWKSTMKRMLNQKKVFLILVDIDDPEHLKVIVELTTCFGSGSRVIITTREKCRLEFHEIERIYEVERLNKEEALQLLSLKAFKARDFDPRYIDILNRAEACAFGNPFALELIGSHMGGKSIEEWESALSQYEIIPNHEIQKILQESFEALEENCRNVLIRIALFLKERELTHVEDSLYHIIGTCPKKYIRVLLDKSFIKINELGRVTLHGLTLDMVKETMHHCRKNSRLSEDVEENMAYPSKPSMLFKDILEENTEYPLQEMPLALVELECHVDTVLPPLLKAPLPTIPRSNAIELEESKAKFRHDPTRISQPRPQRC